VDRSTVARKLRFLATQARLEHQQRLTNLTQTQRFTQLQMDELQSFEHTKCKPLSIPLIVDAQSRLILGVDACVMPANGPLAELSRRKYGPRPNQRLPTLRRLMNSVRPYVDPKHLELASDSHPYYPPLMKSLYPKAKHTQFESRRSAVVGQGELKKGGWDPLFSINHTAAMFRANLSRLVRRSWCTTKKLQCLKDDLILYAAWHNRMIQDSSPLAPI
jgi:hypothetical protein